MRDRLMLIFCTAVLFSHMAHAQFREDVTPVTNTYGDPYTFGDRHALGDLRSDTAIVMEPTDSEKAMYLAGAAFGFALFDYVGYNLVRGNSTTLPIYRVLQGLVQAGITWFLYEKVGLPTAIGFNILWWSWCIDAIYYGYTELFNAGGSWERRGAFHSNIMENHCTWASWTPVGIAQGMDRNKVIPGDTLVAQCLIGAVAALTITFSF